MKRSFLLFVVFTVLAGNCLGQKGWRLRSENYAGVATGERGSSANSMEDLRGCSG
jgi:hypothetical protein